MIITGVLNGLNYNRDSHFQELVSELSTSGVKKGYSTECEIQENLLKAGKCFIEITRDNITPNEIFKVPVQITSDETIDTGGTGYVIIKGNDTKINDGSLNSDDGSAIFTVEVVETLPTKNFLQLASLSSGVITDTRTYTVISNNAKSALTKVDVGLENVDNTSDLDKPVSNLQQEAINAAQQSPTYLYTTKYDATKGQAALYRTSDGKVEPVQRYYGSSEGGVVYDKLISSTQTGFIIRENIKTQGVFVSLRGDKAQVLKRENGTFTFGAVVDITGLTTINGEQLPEILFPDDGTDNGFFAYQTGTESDRDVYFRPFSINLSTLEITLGTEVNGGFSLTYSGSGESVRVQIALIEDNKFLLGYNISTQNGGRMRVITLTSGSSLALGTAYNVNGENNKCFISFAQDPDNVNRFAVGFTIYNSSAYAGIARITGTVISWESSIEFINSSEKTEIFSKTIWDKSEAFAILQTNLNDGTTDIRTLNLYTFTVSASDNILLDERIEIAPNFNTVYTVKVSTGKYIVYSHNTNGASEIKIRIIDILGTTAQIGDSITMDTNYLLYQFLENGEILLFKKSDKKWVIISVSGMTLTKVSNADYTENVDSFISTGTGDEFLYSSPSEWKIFFVGRKNIDVNKIIGVYANDTLADNSAPVSIRSSIAPFYSGLTPLADYYVNDKGEMVTSSSSPNVKIGKAVSDTIISLSPFI